MTPFFPKQISNRAIIVYLLSLVIVSVVYFDYAMQLGYFLLGIAWVLGFFIITSYLSRRWKSIYSTKYIEFLLYLAAIPRLVWVIVSYFYYADATGIPFEFGTGDALFYHDVAEWLASERWRVAWNYCFGPDSVSIADAGYPLYLTLIYKLFGPVIIIPRIIKVALSVWTCVLVYKISVRTFGEGVGKIAGIMCALMPNLIIYCGYHLKETEMIFLEVLFLERLDYLIRTKSYHLWTILIPSLLALSLFLFRTVLGAAALFTFMSAIVFTSRSALGDNMKRVVLIGWGIIGLALLGGGAIMNEAEALWEDRDTSVENKRTEQTLRGNQWAQYATGTVMAPMAFVLPFATMVDVDEQNEQQIKSGGNYIRNFMGFFALIALYEAVRKKKIGRFITLGAFVISYLGVISVSGFSNSERFLLPGLPCLIMMWAYGISSLRKKTYRLLNPWCIIVFIMELGWAYFKLGSRGLL